VQELIAYVKANPGKLSYASSNSIGLMAASMFTRLAGLDLVHVPYRATPQAVTDLMAGRIAMMFIDLAVGLPHVRSGNLRVLAMTTRERSALLPDIPSTVEAGVPTLDVVPWNGTTITGLRAAALAKPATAKTAALSGSHFPALLKAAIKGAPTPKTRSTVTIVFFTARGSMFLRPSGAGEAHIRPTEMQENAATRRPTIRRSRPKS